MLERKRDAGDDEREATGYDAVEIGGITVTLASFSNCLKARYHQPQTGQDESVVHMRPEADN